MKIEKINENQIKCTLNKSDLASRQIKVSELAYGTEKTKLLFRDMMQQAAVEFGFHAEDLPIMIEAIPVTGDSIILIITKVEDPEELDSRFSNFSSDDSDLLDEDALIDDEYLDDMEDIVNETPDEELSFWDMLRRQIKEQLKSPQKPPENSDSNFVKVFSFGSLNTLIQLAGYLPEDCGDNSLYKSDKNGRYYLIMDKSSLTIPNFALICGKICEFGTAVDSSPVSEAYYKEHFEKIIEKNALQKLQSIYTGGYHNGTD
jgi:adapter protein MecA 1/2